jgi:hypothetical protein
MTDNVVDFPNGYFLVDEEKQRNGIREALQALLDANSEMAMLGKEPDASALKPAIDILNASDQDAVNDVLMDE